MGAKLCSVNKRQQGTFILLLQGYLQFIQLQLILTGKISVNNKSDTHNSTNKLNVQLKPKTRKHCSLTLIWLSGHLTTLKVWEAAI